MRLFTLLLPFPPAQVPRSRRAGHVTIKHNSGELLARFQLIQKPDVLP